MLFNSFPFLLGFLPITYGVFWLIKSARWRYVWLAVTGYMFYSYWNPRFCFLMAFSTIVSYAAGLGFLEWHDPRRRRICLIVPVSVDLALLGFFKYANFALGSVQAMTELLGGHTQFPHYNIILPLGISFYTFHTISYIVDSYRGVIKPTRNFFEYAAYVSLFSQLVAGPIVRFRQVEEDLENLGSADRTRWLERGVRFFIIGLVEKVIVADYLAAFVDPALAGWGGLSTIGAWAAILGYTFQLYFDFSGYSTMAVGLGYLFGLRIPQNFNSPYKATDPSDFWKRWHISLSTCLRDYLYIPLGGNRRGELRTYANLLLTMLLGGLWHGANWTFVIWGAYHGLGLAVHRRYSSLLNQLSPWKRRAGTFIFVVLGWVWFRSGTVAMSLGLFRKMFWWSGGRSPENSSTFVIVVLIAAWWAMSGPNAFDIERNWSMRPARAIALAAALGASLAIMAGAGSSPFLYFQF